LLIDALEVDKSSKIIARK